MVWHGREESSCSVKHMCRPRSKPKVSFHEREGILLRSTKDEQISRLPLFLRSFSLLGPLSIVDYFPAHPAQTQIKTRQHRKCACSRCPPLVELWHIPRTRFICVLVWKLSRSNRLRGNVTLESTEGIGKTSPLALTNVVKEDRTQEGKSRGKGNRAAKRLPKLTRRPVHKLHASGGEAERS